MVIQIKSLDSGSLGNLNSIMLIQTQRQISDLNIAYLMGDINFDDYRRKRGFLLDSLFDDITLPKQFATDTVPTKTIKQNRQKSKQSRRSGKSSNTLLILGIFVLALSIIGAVILLITTQ